jgi:glycosyltransferase involved in cell wall biosynthesis
MVLEQSTTETAAGAGAQETGPLAGKRVLVVLGCLDLGGAERQAIHAASCLVERQQAEVEVWAFRPPGRAAELCDRLGIPWRYVPERWSGGPLRWPLMIGRFARTVRRWRPDILLPYTSFPNILCGLSWRLTGARVCIWNQRDAGLDLASPAAPWAVRNTPLFLSNSAVGEQFLTQSLGVSPRRVRVVRNAVHLDPPRHDRAAWRATLGADATCLVCTVVANLQKNKDHETLLRTWRIVCDRLPAPLARQAGEGPEARAGYALPDLTGRNLRPLLVLAGRLDAPAAIQRLIGELQLDQSVRLLGEVDDVSGLLSAADLGLLSSRSEGCPNGVLESMAAGLAVVATDCPGIREAVGDAGTPWLAPAGDAEAMAERILRLAADAGLRAELGAANRRRIASEFTRERLNTDLAALLASALATRRWP